MNKIFAIAASVLLIASSGAYAAEGRNRSTPIYQSNGPLVGNPLAANVGSQRQSPFDTSVELPVVMGAIIPPTGSNGLIQTANSLPSAPEIQGAWANPDVYAAAHGGVAPDSAVASVTRPGNAS